MHAAHHPDRQPPPRRWYAPDYRRQLRDAGAFRHLSASAQVVHAALCDRANAAGVAWPAVETIARDYGLAESTVRRVLAELAGAGLVLVARRAGRVSRYALVAPKAGAANCAPPLDAGGDPSQFETPPLSNPAPIMTMDHFNDHEKQHDSAETGATVVVEEETSTEDLAAERQPANDIRKDAEPGAILLLEPDIVDRARVLGLEPAKVNRYGTDRVRWVLDALVAERERRMIGNPAGWVMQALREQWELPGPVAQRTLPLSQAAAAVSKPPEGTRWARVRSATIALEVLDANDDRVQLADGSVVPAHLWTDWEWFAEYPGTSVGTGNDSDNENLVDTDAQLSAEKGATLARLRLWVSLRPRAGAELDAKLEALGLTSNEWEAYLAAEAWLEASE